MIGLSRSLYLYINDCFSVAIGISTLSLLMLSVFTCFITLQFYNMTRKDNFTRALDYLGPSIKEKGDMLKRLIVEKENLGRNDESMVIKDADSPKPRKME